MEHLNWLGILAASVAAFVFGAVWFSVLFGGFWQRIHHGGRTLSAEEMRAASQGMWRLLLPEFLATFVMITTLDFALRALPAFSGAHVGFMLWFGFVLPTYVSATLWGNDPKKWMCAKIALMAGSRLVVLLAAGYVLAMWR